MNLEAAVEKAEDLDEIKDILDEEGFLCSAYLMLEEGEGPEVWNLAFYSEGKNEITAVEVTSEDATLGVTDAPLREDTGKISLEEVKVGAKEGLEKVKKVLEEEFGGSYKKLLFSLKSEGGRQEWRAVFVGKSLSIIVISLDAETGEVLEKEKKSMNRNGLFGS
ncbi:MAG: hypothetical protein ACLFTQ_01800 [Candidatus Aenigmatarchaeota archaeon]